MVPSSEHAIIYRDSETPGEPVRFRNAVRTWLIKIVEGRYRCWEDFLTYGMVSAGHDNPPGPPLQLLSVGDEIYAFLSPRGYVGRGQVTKAAVLADYFVVDGDFIAKDGSGRFSRVMLTDILLLRRSDMREDGDDPLMGEWVVGVKWLDTCAKKRAKRFAGMQEPRDTVDELNNEDTKNFLASAFATASGY